MIITYTNIIAIVSRSICNCCVKLDKNQLVADSLTWLMHKNRPDTQTIAPRCELTEEVHVASHLVTIG